MADLRINMMRIYRNITLNILVCSIVFHSCGSLRSYNYYNVTNSDTGVFVQTGLLLNSCDRCVVLSSEKDLSSQLTRSNTEYLIKKDFDLNGDTIYLPSNSVFRFEGGSFRNGTLVGSKSAIINKQSSVIFGPSITLVGTWCVDYAHSNWFYIDPIDATNPVSWLIERAMEGTSVTFDKIEYRVSLKYRNNTCYDGYRYSAFYAKSRCVNLNFNGATILDRTEIKDGVNVNFICLDNCSGSISDLCFSSISLNDNNQKEYDSGKVVVHCINNCHDLSLHITSTHVRTCVESGRFDWHRPSLLNSSINVNLKHGGYGVALYDGKNLNIVADADFAHRGVYLGGCVESDVYVKCGKVSTGVACLLKDTRLLCNNEKVFIQSDKLNVETYCYCYSGDTINNVQFASYNIQDFADRTTPYTSTINIKSIIRPVSDAANVRVFNIYGDSRLDTLKAKVAFDVDFIDSDNVRKDVVLYNNPQMSLSPCNFYTDLSFTGTSSQPLVLKQEHMGEYRISLSDIRACVNNSNYTGGYINLFLGSKTNNGITNKLYLSNCPVSYVRRSDPSLKYCFPDIYADSSSVVYISDKSIASSIAINTKREIITGKPYVASIFATLKVELDGKANTLSIKNPNGLYYWATKGQIFTVILSNIKSSTGSRVLFDDTIIPMSKEVVVPPGAVCHMELIWTGEKFKVMRTY